MHHLDITFPHDQAFCSSITGALATLAVLKGVGVGDSSATPLAAAITWMLKGKVRPVPQRIVRQSYVLMQMALGC